MSGKSFSVLFSDDGESAPRPAANPKKQAEAKPAAAKGGNQDKASPKPQGGAQAGRNNHRERPPRGSQANTGHRAPKRVFERHSGTGRDRSVRKDGAGAFAWGSAKDTTPLDTAVPAEAAAAAPAAEETKVEVAPEPEPEPIFSFDDAMKMRQANAVAGDHKAARAAIVSDAVKPGATINPGKNIGGGAKKAQSKNDSLVVTKKSGKHVLDFAAFNAVVAPSAAPVSAAAGSEGGNYRRRTQFPSL